MPELRNGFLRVAPHTYVNVNRIRLVDPDYDNPDGEPAARVHIDGMAGWYPLAGVTPEEVLDAIHADPEPPRVMNVSVPPPDPATLRDVIDKVTEWGETR